MLRILCLVGLHRRSPTARARDAGGTYRSVCKRCGVGMLRDSRSGRWLAMRDRDRRRNTRWIRRGLDQLTGPALFIMLLGLALGFVLYLKDPNHF